MGRKRGPQSSLFFICTNPCSSPCVKVKELKNLTPIFLTQGPPTKICSLPTPYGKIHERTILYLSSRSTNANQCEQVSILDQGCGHPRSSGGRTFEQGPGVINPSQRTQKQQQAVRHGSDVTYTAARSQLYHKQDAIVDHRKETIVCMRSMNL